MKTLKFITKSFAVLFAIILLSIGNVTAQTEKTVAVSTYDFEDFYVGCAGENIDGTETLEFIMWNTPVGVAYLAKYSWTGIGDISGAFYEAHGQQIVRINDLPLSGESRTWRMTTIIKRNGVPMMKGHQDFRLMVNPDGTITANSHHVEINCILLDMRFKLHE